MDVLKSVTNPRNAFEQYLVSIPSSEAAAHVLECLRRGSEAEEAWRLMADIYGPNWAVQPEEMFYYIEEGLKQFFKGAYDA